jgi:hypothetical protein
MIVTNLVSSKWFSDKYQKKTITLSFHSWQNKIFLKPQIRFSDIDIKYKDETKFFGLRLTECIKSDVHIKRLSTK